MRAAIMVGAAVVVLATAGVLVWHHGTSADHAAPATPAPAREETRADPPAIERARESGDPSSVAWLAEVASGNADQATAAAAALGRVASPAAAAELAKLAAGDGPVIVRANAARALAKSGGAAQVETLVALASGDTQPLRVRQEAALALGAIRDPAAVPALVQALQRAEPDGSRDGEQLRISIVQALGALGTTEARAALSAHSQRPLSTTEAAFTARGLSR